MKEALARLLSVAVGIALATAVAEAGVRVFSPQRTGPVELTYDGRVGSVPVPNRRGTVIWPGVYRYTYTNDHLGLRVTGVVDRQRARARVLFLGDSFTYGTGVNDDQTFAYQLEQRFAQAGVPVAMINAGNGGKGTSYALRFLETIGRSLPTDLVVLCFFPNDFRDNVRTYVYRIEADGKLIVNPALGKVYRQKGLLNRSRLYDWFISWSHLANVIKQASIRIIRTRIRENENDALVFYPETGKHLSKESIRATRIYLNALSREVASRGVPLLVTYVSRAEDVRLFRRTGGFSAEEVTLRRLLPERAAFLSVTATLARSPYPIEALYFDEGGTGRYDGHFTPLAHDLVAGVLSGPIQVLLQPRLSETR